MVNIIVWDNYLCLLSIIMLHIQVYLRETNRYGGQDKSNPTNNTCLCWIIYNLKQSNNWPKNLTI